MTLSDEERLTVRFLLSEKKSRKETQDLAAVMAQLDDAHVNGQPAGAQPVQQDEAAAGAEAGAGPARPLMPPPHVHGAGAAPQQNLVGAAAQPAHGVNGSEQQAALPGSPKVPARWRQQKAALFRLPRARAETLSPHDAEQPSTSQALRAPQVAQQLGIAQPARARNMPAMASTRIRNSIAELNKELQSWRCRMQSKAPWQTANGAVSELFSSCNGTYVKKGAGAFGTAWQVMCRGHVRVLKVRMRVGQL